MFTIIFSLNLLNQHPIIRVWMGFSVKWYLPIILSVLLFFLFGCLLLLEKNNVKCLEGFSWKARSLLALSTAPGKSVKKSSKALWQSPDIYRLRQSCVVFGNLPKLSGIVGKQTKTPWYTNQNNIGLLGAVYISFSAFWKKYRFSEILLQLLVLKCAKLTVSYMLQSQNIKCFNT